MRSVEIVESLQAERGALEHTATLISEISALLTLITPDLQPHEIHLGVSLVRARWEQLDELGVDLNLPDLKSLVAAHTANHPMSSGADAAQRAATADERESPLRPPIPAPLDADDEPFVREV